jgi:hypothetical protein
MATPNDSDAPEQLRMLDDASVPLQLRLDERTRRIGLRGVAMARALLDEQRRRREDTADTTPRHRAEQHSTPPRAA